jgi:hypothetical protein
VSAAGRGPVREPDKDQAWIEKRSIIRQRRKAEQEGKTR